MRLNFSGVGDEEIREGVRRIGKVIGEQMELYGTLTGEHCIDPHMPAGEAEDMGGLIPVESVPSISDSRGRFDDPRGDVLPYRRAQ